MQPLRWRLYYGDGSVYEGVGDEEAFAAPSLNVQILKQEADNVRGYTIRHGCNFYVWERVQLSTGGVLDVGRWGGKGDLFGLMDYYSFHKGPQKVLIGREIHDDTYHEISKMADNDGCLCTELCDHLIPAIGKKG